MKKLITLIILVALFFGIWKYLSIKSQPASSEDGQPSVIKDVKDTVQRTVDYVPDSLERKKQMENSINDSLAKESQQLQKAMEQVK
jgi:hypothetical protein